MGMASSQARLLGLTTEMHNLEYKAQRLLSEKTDLALRQDQAYQEYCDALDASKIQVGRKDAATGKVNYIDACFNTLCGYQPLNCCQYSLVNNLNGRVIVTSEIKDLYDRYSNNQTGFIWAAMGYEDQTYWQNGLGPWGNCNNNVQEFIGIGTNVNYGCPGQEFPLGLDPPAGFGMDLYMNEAEYLVFLSYYEAGSTDPLSKAYDDLLNASQTNKPKKTRQELLNTFRTELYKHSQEILNAMNMDKTQPPEDPAFNPTHVPNEFSDNLNWDYMKDQFKYYQKLWEQIKNAGGCEVIDPQYQSGEDGVDWLKFALTSGQVSLFTLDTTKEKGWEETTALTTVSNNYLQQVSDDELVKRAEVTYENKVRLLNQKDTRIDEELKKLDTKEQACKTERDSLKQVINDNINRAFDTTT